MSKPPGILYAFLFVVLVLAAASGLAGPGSLTYAPRPAPAAPPNQAAAGGWYTVYFTSPDPVRSSGGEDELLAEAADNALASVDVAMYEFTLWGARDALLEARARGVRVRLVVGKDSLDNDAVLALAAAGIPVAARPDENGIMHHKFMVIDGAEVWTGSANYTFSSIYRDHNNLIRLADPAIAAAYTQEFEAMFTAQEFGPARPPQPPLTFQAHGVEVEVLFAPEMAPESRLVELIRSARESIALLAYSFTSEQISSAVLDQARAGVHVQAVFDEDQSGGGGLFNRLRLAGVDVWPDGSEGKMHHKVIIIDGQIVVLGSYNFTKSANTINDENLLVIHSPEIARPFLDEFARIYQEAARP